MWSDKSVWANNDALVTISSLFCAPVKMRKNRSPQTYRGIVPNLDALWMKLVNIHLLADPYVLANLRAPEPVHHWSETVATRSEEGYFVQDSTEQLVHGVISGIYSTNNGVRWR